MERYKAIAIPYLKINGTLYFLMVHDRRFKEWTFVTGGCRRNEIVNPLKCALRELEEETRGIIKITSGFYTHYRFRVHDSKESPPVTNIYSVYLMEYPLMTLQNQSWYVEMFNKQKHLMDSDLIKFRKHYDENDFLQFKSLEDIRNIPNLWPMIRTEVIQNKKFHSALYSLNKNYFNINNDKAQRRYCERSPKSYNGRIIDQKIIRT